MKKILTLACCLLLTSCIPMIKAVYHAPKVTGVVVDLATMQPLAGVVVSHLEYPQLTVVTDKNGQFALPSQASTEFMLLMPGYAIKPYMIKFTTPTSASLLSVDGSFKMYSEEVVTLLAPVVIDQNPGLAAQPPAAEYASHQQLLASLIEDNLFSHCRHDLGLLAVANLNLARKLYHQHQQEPESELVEQLTAANYEFARSSWELFYFSCNDDPTDFKTRPAQDARRAWHERIKEESGPRFASSAEQRDQYRAMSNVDD